MLPLKNLFLRFLKNTQFHSYKFLNLVCQLTTKIVGLKREHYIIISYNSIYLKTVFTFSGTVSFLLFCHCLLEKYTEYLVYIQISLKACISTYWGYTRSKALFCNLTTDYIIFQTRRMISK